MGLRETLKGMFGRRPGPEMVSISLQGKATRVSQAELSILNKMSEVGLVTKDPTDASIGTGNFTQGVPAFWFARALEVGGQEALTSPYERSVWVQRAIKNISGPVSSVRVCFLSAQGGEASGIRSRKSNRRKRVWTAKGLRTAGKDMEPEEVDLPAVRQWLARPMKGLNYSDFVEASIGWLKLQECFWLLSDQALKPFPEVSDTPFPPVIVASPRLMRPVVEEGELMGWVYTQSKGKTWNLLPEQVIQLRYWNPDNEFRGTGEYPSAHLAAESDYLAGKFSRNLMANNGDLGGLIISKGGVPPDDQQEQIIMALRSKREAQLRGDLRYTFMTGDIDVKDPKITSVDSAFISQRLENRHEIALAFGQPPSMFDVKAAYSIGSASDNFQLITNTCIPTGEKFCDALERLIFQMTGEIIEVGLEWDEHPVMQQVRRERIEAVDRLWSKGMPMSAINDYLGLEMEEYEGWDVGYLPFNVTAVGEEEPEPAVNPMLAEQTQRPQSGAEERGEDKAPEEVKAVLKILRNGHEKAQKSKSKNHELWEAHMRKRAAVMKQFESKFNKVLAGFRAKALRKLAEHGSATGKGLAGRSPLPTEAKALIDFIFDGSEFGKQLSVSLKPLMESTLQVAADQVRKDELGLSDPWLFPPRMAIEFVDSRKQSVQGCGETVRNQLNTALNEGVTEGESTEQISDRIRGVFNALAKGEAKRIAMTETGMAFNFSRHEAMTSAGVRLKKWLSSHGPHVRPAHEEAEARYSVDPIPMDEPFEVDGEELMYPGDPSGSPENVINCQCIQVAAR